MFHVKTILKESAIHGIGLFADEAIAQGALIYSPNDALDLHVNKDTFLALSEDEQATIKHYGYVDEKAQAWHLSFDDIRFCNHSTVNNITKKGKNVIAKRAIKKGEELTHNYREFESPIRAERHIKEKGKK